MRATVLLALSLAACGGTEPEKTTDIKRTSLSVAADPPGHKFSDPITIELASSAGEIYYTLDGESPAGENGLLYEAPIDLDASAFLTFIAVDGDRYSTPETELYTFEEVPIQPGIPVRALRPDDDSLVFTARRGSPGVMRKTVQIRSVGLQEVTIDDIYVTLNPTSWSFWEEGIFQLEEEIETPKVMFPGETLELTVAYTPTETIRTAALVVVSNDERHEDGVIVVDLMGRIFDW